MSTRYFILALALTFAIPNAEAATNANSAPAQKTATTAGARTVIANKPAKSTKKRRASGGRGAYFVPPPPAYMPSVLPELYTRHNVIDEEEEEEVVAALAPKPKNPYVQYFYTRDAQAPKPVHQRNGVSTWTAVR